MNANEPLVSVLFVTYKRVHLLERTLDSFRKNSDYSNLELVVSDDGSPAAMQQQIRRLGFDKFVLAGRNRGMGTNVNAGLAACSGKYILFLQDDWECRGPARYLRDSVAVMEANPRVAIVKFYGKEHTRGIQLTAPAADPCYAVADQGPPGPGGYCIYSDTPHLKARAALAELGPYREDCGMEQCERDYDTRFSTQRHYVAAFFPAYYNQTFLHTGSEESFRTRSLQYRTRQLLAGWAAGLRKSCPSLYQAGRRCYRRMSGLERDEL